MSGFKGKIRGQLLAIPPGEWDRTDLGFQQAVSQAILCQELDLAEKDAAARYFGPYRLPGTMSIGYRRNHPEIFQDTTESAMESFDAWVNRSVGKILKKMKDKGALSAGMPLTEQFQAEMVRKISLLLEFETAEGVRLRDAIPQQTYEDIFIRMVMLVWEGEPPDETMNFYEEFNAIGHRIALALIDRIENSGAAGMQTPAGVAKLIQLGVLSGYVGINLKSSASAASTLLNRNFIPLKEAWIRSIDTVKSVSESEINAVVDHLLAVSEMPAGKFGLESLRRYQEEVLQTAVPTLLVFFCDDYIESILDMKRFEMILDSNPQLTVLFIPRNGRYGNDIAYEDMGILLKEAQFRSLQKHLASGRFIVSPDGPRSGCIDPRFMNRNLIQVIRAFEKGRRVIFETKGCRNFEMLQGNLQVPWYAGFNCNRALSIRTVGVDGPPVFIRIPPGLKAYDGFTRPTIGPSPSYQTAQVKYARMTTNQLFAALESPIYQSLAEISRDELRLNSALTGLGESLELPFCELITVLNNRGLTA
jgi:hypothetical protein